MLPSPCVCTSIKGVLFIVRLQNLPPFTLSLFALQAAAKFLREPAESFPSGFLPRNPTQQAVVAIKVYEVFRVEKDEVCDGELTARKHAIIEAIIAAYKKSEAEGNT